MGKLVGMLACFYKVAKMDKFIGNKEEISADRTVVTSLQNPQIKNVVKLRERRHRDRQGLMLIEGLRELTLAVDSGVQLKRLFYCEELVKSGDEMSLLKQAGKAGVPLFTVTKMVFRKITYKEHPDGLLAVASQPGRSLKDLTLGPTPLVVVAVAIEKPGNLGAIMRSADAAGVDGVIVCDRCTDIYNPNVVRSSLGTLFSIQVVEGSAQETVEWLKEKGLKIVASSPHSTVEYTTADLTSPCAIVLGSEKLGLSDLWMDASDEKIHIQMRGRADSLNVAMTATILLYEAIRQRGLK